MFFIEKIFTFISGAAISWKTFPDHRATSVRGRARVARIPDSPSGNSPHNFPDSPGNPSGNSGDRPRPQQTPTASPAPSPDSRTVLYSLLLRISSASCSMKLRKDGSVSICSFTVSIEYETVEWSRPPNALPMSVCEAFVMVRAR